MKTYPGRLYHAVPAWVPDGAIFHIRLRAAADQPVPLTNEGLAAALIRAALFYDEQQHWYVHLMVLMPDHLHALLSFPREASMSPVLGQWKRYHARQHALRWQEGYFDHRIRNDAEFVEKAAYIRRNPVAKGLCAHETDWPWQWERGGSRRPPD